VTVSTPSSVPLLAALSLASAGGWACTHDGASPRAEVAGGPQAPAEAVERAPERPACVPGAFAYAPAPVPLDDRLAVPIDVLALEAELVFDVAAGSAAAAGVLRFQLGETGGMPIFDLRQTPASLELDGVAVKLDSLARHDFGVGLDAGFLILEVALEPCSIHELAFAYPLDVPQAPKAAGPSFSTEPASVHFDLYSSDLAPGRYLESWLPANMPWDRHPISLAVTLLGAEIEHALITNARVETHAAHTWQLEFPASSTTMDPMLVITPRAPLDVQAGVHRAVNSQDIPYAVYVDEALGRSAAEVTATLTAYLDEFVVMAGPYVHPAMTAYVVAQGRSMEYAGATTTAYSALGHELFHSWWARGLSPATYADGWVDEGWTVFSTGRKSNPIPFDWSAAPRLLYDPHPFARETPQTAYTYGALLFAGLADALGLAELRAAMIEFYIRNDPPASFTTAQLEQHLHCASGEHPAVRAAFHRFVYGRDGEPGAAPEPCRSEQ
jgi:hypothetical protein